MYRFPSDLALYLAASTLNNMCSYNSSDKPLCSIARPISDCCTCVCPASAVRRELRVSDEREQHGRPAVRAHTDTATLTLTLTSPQAATLPASALARRAQRHARTACFCAAEVPTCVSG